MSEQRTDFVPLAPVQLVKPNGTVRPFGLGATSDAARGTALMAAQMAAASGDVIMVFADCNPTGTIGKNGVRYWFAPVRIYGSSYNIGIASGSFQIDGYAFFEQTGVGELVSIGGGMTAFSLHCRKLKTGSNGAALHLDAGICHVVVTDAIETGYPTGYDSIWIGPAVTDSFVSCPYVKAGQDGVEIEGKCQLHLGYVHGGDTGIRMLSGCDAVVYADEINGGNTAINAHPSPSGDPALLDLFVGRVTGAASRWLTDDIPGTGDDRLRIVGAEFANIPQGIEVGGPGLILENCVFLNSGSDIMSDSGGSVEIRGNYTATEPFGLASITYTGQVNKINGVAPTTAGLALLDDVNAAAQRATLGVNKRLIVLYPFAPTADVEVANFTTGEGTAQFRVPSALNGAVLSLVHSQVSTSGSTGGTTTQFKRDRGGSVVDMLSTAMTIDSGEKGSDTGTAGTINSSNATVQTGDIIMFGATAVSTTKPKGLQGTAEFTL